MRRRRPNAAPAEPSTGPPPADVASGARADAFISYARRDEPFVRATLANALAERGKAVWLDVKDIPPAADWRDRIRAGIAAARTFVFVISSESVASRPCLDELEHAENLNKPLIVVVRADVSRDRLPAALERVEWIFLREIDSLDEGIAEIVLALDTDLAWRDLHNELSVRAREWVNEGRDTGLLLRGRPLAEAERWETDPGPHRESPTADQVAYIQASRRAAMRRLWALAIAVATALVVSSSLAVYAIIQRDQAISRERTATSLALAAAGDRELVPNLGASLVLSLEAYRARGSVDARSSMIAALEHARRFGFEALLCCHDGALDSLAFSRDGTTAAAGADDGTVLIWDVRAHRLRARFMVARQHAIRSLAFSPDGRIVALSTEGTVELTDVRTGQLLGRLRESANTGVSALAFSPDGSTIAVGEFGTGLVRLWNVHSLKLVGSPLQAVPGSVTSVAFDSDGRLLAFASGTSGKYGGGGVSLWNVRTHHLLAVPVSGSVTNLALPDRGRTLATVDLFGSLRLVELQGGGLPSPERQLETRGAVTSAAFSPDGQLLAFGKKDGTTDVWDVQTRQRLVSLRGHGGAVSSVALGSSRTVASAGDDGTVMVWQLGALKPFGQALSARAGLADYGFNEQLGVEAPNPFAFSRDGRVVATVDGSHVAVRDARTGELLQSVPIAAAALAFGPGGRTLVLAADRIRVWDLEADRQVTSFPQRATSVAVGRDGTIATGGPDGVAVRDSQGRDHPVEGGGGASCVALNPDGHTLAVASVSGVRLWNTAQLGRSELSLNGTGWVDCLAFSPNGDTLATAGWDGTVRLWDVASGRQLGQPLFRYTGPATALSRDVISGDINFLGPVAGVSFSPDGETLASVHADGTIRLWDVRSRRELGQTLRAHDAALEAVGFRPDGDALATSGANGVVRLWQGFLWSNFADLRTQVCGLVVGSLSNVDWDRLAPGLPYRSTCPT